jgi:16S rRNA processing protein RimM
MTESHEKKISIGQFGKAHGVQGWITVSSFTEKPTDLFCFEALSIKSSKENESIFFENYLKHSDRFIAKIKGIDDRDSVIYFVNKQIQIHEKCMRELSEEEFYWHQLKGLKVKTFYHGCEQLLGIVESIIETGSNDVLVVKGNKESIDTKERVISCANEFLVGVNLKDGFIEVDWDPEF